MAGVLKKIEKFLIFLFFLLLPSQTALHYWNAQSYLFGHRVDYLSPTLYLTDILMLSLLVLWQIKLKITWQHLFILLIIVANSFGSENIFLSLYRFTSLILSIYFFVNLFKKYSPQSFLIITPLSVSLIWTAVLAWVQWFSQSETGFLAILGERPLSLSVSSTAKVPLFNFGLVLRSYATFPHPNALAGFLLLSSIYLIVFQRNKLTFFSTLLSLFSLPLTFSRTVSFALISEAVIWMLAVKAKFSPKFLKAALLIIIILGLFLIPGNPNSLTERLNQLPTATGIILHHPIFGVGLGNYLYFVPASQLQIVHNTWLLLLAELGIPLFIALSILLFKYIFYTLKAFPTSFLLFWPILITSLSDNYWITLHQTSLLVIFVICSLNSYLTPAKE